VNGVEMGTWYGILAPVGTSQKIIRRLNQVVNNGLTSKEVIEVFSAEGSVILGGTPEQFKNFMTVELKKNETIVKAAAITSN